MYPASNTNSTSWFQSSPALSSGRYPLLPGVTSFGTSFQSSPALSSGRYPFRPRRVTSSLCFNPRPLFRAGATALPHQGQKTWGLALVFANLLLTHQDVLAASCPAPSKLLRNKNDRANANLPGFMHRLMSAQPEHHRTSGSSKSTLPSNPYTCTCFSFGSVIR